MQANDPKSAWRKYLAVWLKSVLIADMKNKIPTALIAISIAMALGNAKSTINGESQDLAKCTVHPCPNTQTGEDPGVVEAREGGKIDAELREDPNDKDRWSSVILFSSSTERQQLSMPIVMSAKFDIALNPKRGTLTFSSPSASQSFRISDTSSGSDSRNPCKKYQIRVIEAGMDYALVKKICPKQEYRPQKFYRGSDYYIYDQKTNTMREIWSASTQIDSSSPFPTAKPEISIKKVKEGYEFNWNGMFPSDNPPKSMTIHNIYKREVDEKGRQSLVCYDASDRRHLIKENEMCESASLEQIRN